MINSRHIEELHPHVQLLANQMIEECKKAEIDLLITSTYRDFESQNALYAQGRTTPGKIVTNAKGGQSYHNWRVAFDVVPIVNGKAMWNDSVLWQKIGAIGRSSGLEWAGDWKKFKEFPHFQFTGGLTLADFQQGKQVVIA
ncbi:MAG: M15 family metallopeptidase [Chlorobaculum sp.]|nr:M15 family metallopeptidase [Chlorobaculum sp.]